MTRKPNPAAQAEPTDAASMLPAHPLPTEGGTYTVVDGVLHRDAEPDTPTVKAEPKVAAPVLPAHPLPIKGGTYTVVDGVLRPDAEMPTPDPEV